MKKKYVLILEFEAGISRKVLKGFGKNKMDMFFAALFKEVLKNDNVVRDLYSLMLMSELADDTHIFEMETDIHDPGIKDEFAILKPVLQCLPDDAAAYFLNIFETDDDSREEFFERFFSQFGKLKIVESNFMEKKKDW